MNRPLLAVGAAIVVMALAGCTSNNTLANQYSSGSGQGYTSGDGAYKEIPPESRGDVITFSGESAEGTPVSSADYAGRVYVVNFWYASCPPCRLDPCGLPRSRCPLPGRDLRLQDTPRCADRHAHPPPLPRAPPTAVCSYRWSPPECLASLAFHTRIYL